ncbi:MAG: hypothetical protein HUJ84_05710 [Veillonella sp.]|nr:hypothetical protein [Veillonella sp.]MCF0156761.1 hypothetical protein [Veillonella sp.]
MTNYQSFKEKMLQNAEVKAEYDKLEAEFTGFKETIEKELENKKDS